jgi:hypothetical protein
LQQDREHYLGARYYKCDLHMHTPGDAQSWRDQATRVTSDTTDARRAKIARKYLSYCHTTGLEVIGITDHNFARAPEESFINDLREANNEVAKELGRAPLVILPGFEIEANVGKGCHVLCLFPEDTDLRLIESRLTNCGLPWDSRFRKDGSPVSSRKCLTEIIDVVQNTKDHAGLVISAHSLAGKGVLADESLKMWLQQEEFKNPDLLCIEISKPIEELPQGLSKLIIGGDECSPEWRRGTGDAERPIAYICSSDCHRLESSENDPSNYIGFRHTWIRMSDPGIEALRQAFLDRESRIRLGSTNPDHDYQHSWIMRVEVDGATFYRATPLHLSPNLNCVIGSRGSGKSTLIDYMRLALDRLHEDDLPSRLRDDIMDRVNNTLDENSMIVVDFETSGVPYRVEYRHIGDGWRTVSRLDTGEQNPEWSIRTLFPVRTLSQREIDESVERDDHKFLTKLLDEFIVDELEELHQRETDLRNLIKAIDLSIKAKKDAQQRRTHLVTSLMELKDRIARLESVRQPLQRWAVVTGCDSRIKQLLEHCNDFSFEMRNQLEKSYENLVATIVRTSEISEPLCSSTDMGYSTGEDGDEAGSSTTITTVSAIMSEVETIVIEALQECYQTIDNAIQRFEEATGGESEPLESLLKSKWEALYETEKAEYGKLRKRLEAHGDDPEEYLSIKNQIGAISASLEQLNKEREEINRLERQRTESLVELRKVWQCQTEARKRKAQELMERLRPAADGKPFVAIEIAHQADRNAIVEHWASRIKDRRRLNEDDISRVVNLAEEDSEKGEYSIQESMIHIIRTAEAHPGLSNVLGTRTETFLDVFSEDVLRELEIERINDRVEYKVYRQDGSLAGPIDRVSVGQKGLAFLNVLLAAGDAPILVDTPEEGLDSEGVYAELVPTFRREKERRQLIIATHNANIPVNADAELVVTLETVGTVDLYAPGLESMLVENQVAVGLEEGCQQPATEHPASRRPRQLPSLDLLRIRVMGKDWHSNIREYLLRRCGWTEEQADRFVELIAIYREVCGGIRSRGGDGGRLDRAVGALDNREVKRAVQDIMEGSEHAFRKRREKYGF